MRQNMQIVLLFAPSIVTFIGMRQVAEENVQRERVVQGERRGEFQNIGIEMKDTTIDSSVELESKE